MDLCDKHAHIEEEDDETAIGGEVFGNHLVDVHPLVGLFPQWAVDRDMALDYGDDGDADDDEHSLTQISKQMTISCF